MSQYHEYFHWGGVESRQHHVWISGEDTFVAPERDVTIVDVPGRNGMLTLDNGKYKNFPITYPCYMSENFLTDFDTFKNAMLSQIGYQNLRDTYHPNGFRKARLTKGITPKPGPYNKSAKFDLTFDCYPQFFLDSGQQFVSIASGGTTLVNPTGFEAKPLIMVTWTSGTGRGTLTINGKRITISGATIKPLYINCDIQRAYYTQNQGGTAVYVDNWITLDDGEFPTLAPGNNSCSWTSQNSTLAVSIAPEWWQL